MIDIKLNGKAISVPVDAVLVKILEKQAYIGKGFAVAVNSHFVPRSEYEKMALKQGDEIDIVAPMQGG